MKGSGLLRVASNDAEGNNIAFKGLDAVRQCASKFFKTAESGVDKVVSSCEKNPSVHWRYMNFLRQRKTALDAPLYAVSAGRSMIEMLGVLAIIAVLTVGGIAGYSKAMKKYQANKVVGEIIQVLVKLKELSENDNWYNIYRLDDETKKTLGLCLPSAENCSEFQRTPVGEIDINGNVFMSDADAELCISAFNNIFIPLKGNIREFTVATVIKNWDDAYEERKECDKKCSDKCKEDMDCIHECYSKCSKDNSPYAGICISEDKKNCSNGKEYLNLYDSRVATEINAACNSGFDKKVSSIRIIFKKGFAIEYLH